MHVPRSSLIAPLHRSKIEQHARTTSLWTLVLIDKPLAASLYAALKLHSTTTFGGLCVGKLDCLRSTLVVMQRCMKTLYETLYEIACVLAVFVGVFLNTASPPCDGPAVTAYSHTAPYSGVYSYSYTVYTLYIPIHPPSDELLVFGIILCGRGSIPSPQVTEHCSQLLGRVAAECHHSRCCMCLGNPRSRTSPGRGAATRAHSLVRSQSARIRVVARSARRASIAHAHSKCVCVCWSLYQQLTKYH